MTVTAMAMTSKMTTTTAATTLDEPCPRLLLLPDVDCNPGDDTFLDAGKVELMNVDD